MQYWLSYRHILTYYKYQTAHPPLTP